jgi:hypothetical protein
MDPNTVFPARIDDVGAFFESQPRHCNGGNPDPTCWVDVATHGSCQVSLVWWGDVGKFKGHAVERETLVEMATPMLGERKDFPGCSGDLQTVVTDYANWHVAVKAFGLDLWE